MFRGCEQAQTSPQEHTCAEFRSPVALEHWHLASTGALHLQMSPQVHTLALDKSPVVLEQSHDWIFDEAQLQSLPQLQLAPQELLMASWLLQDCVEQHDLLPDMRL